MPGANVTLTNAGTGISVVKQAAADGNYEFAAVRPGTYLVTAEQAGFAMAMADNVQIEVGARRRVDLQMPVGQVTEKVEVTATSPLLETDSSQRGQVISGDQTRALPLLSREYSSLALLTTALDPSIATHPECGRGQGGRAAACVAGHTVEPRALADPDISQAFLPCYGTGTADQTPVRHRPAASGACLGHEAKDNTGQ